MRVREIKLQQIIRTKNPYYLADIVFAKYRSIANALLNIDIVKVITGPNICLAEKPNLEQSQKCVY